MTYLPPTKNSNATFMSFFITDLWNSTKKVPYWGLTEKINLPSTWKTRDGGRKLRAVPLPRSPLTSALPNRQRSTTPRLQLPSWCAKAAFFVKTTKRIKDGFVWRFNWLHIYIEYVYMYSGSMYIYIYTYIQYTYMITRFWKILISCIYMWVITPSILKPLHHWGSDLAWDGMA